MKRAKTHGLSSFLYRQCGLFGEKSMYKKTKSHWREKKISFSAVFTNQRDYGQTHVKGFQLPLLIYKRRNEAHLMK